MIFVPSGLRAIALTFLFGEVFTPVSEYGPLAVTSS